MVNSNPKYHICPLQWCVTYYHSVRRSHKSLTSMVCCFRTQLLFILPRNAHEVVSQLPTPTPNQRSTTQNRY